jgi:hypothetical protein
MTEPLNELSLKMLAVEYPEAAEEIRRLKAELQQCKADLAIEVKSRQGWAKLAAKWKDERDTYRKS